MRTLLLAALLIVVTCVSFAGYHVYRAEAGAPQYTVNTTDGTNDGSCGSLPSGDCSLPDAIALATTGTHIRFDIPGTDPGCDVTGLCTITPGANGIGVLDVDSLDINGYTQPGSSENSLGTGDNAVIKIQIDMSNVTLGSEVVSITAPGVAIYGLAIFDVDDAGMSAVIRVASAANNSRLRGNFIGFDAAGNADDPAHNLSGIVSAAVDNIDIGGSDVGDRNIIGGNYYRVWIIGTDHADIRNNYIGTNPAGTAASSTDSNFGIDIDFSEGSNIGALGDGNLISGNLQAIYVTSSDDLVIQGNNIGLNASLNAAVPNEAGIRIGSGDNFLIGGVGPGLGNTISGNTGHGISIQGSTTSGQIAGNRIGLDGSGNVVLPNTGAGIYVQGGVGITIGGGQAAARNHISGQEVGVYSAAPGTVIQRNWVGMNSVGSAALGNTTGIIALGSDTVIAQNVVSGNTDGIVIASGTDMVVRGNAVGLTGALDASLPNVNRGIVAGSDGAIIGGATGNDANVIATNGDDGIAVTNPVTVDAPGAGSFNVAFTGNLTIRRNSIFANGGLGIDLDANGPNGNDDNDADSGPNGLQNAPELTTAFVGSTYVAGSLESTPSRSFRIEMFTSPNCDASGFGEGRVYRGQQTVTTDANGYIAFLLQDTSTVNVGSGMAVTATDLTTGATSEFSNCVDVLASAPTPGPSATPTPTPLPVETPEPSVAITEEPTPISTPTPTPTPTATPSVIPSGTPTGTPTGTATQGATPTQTGAAQRRQGDVDCSGEVTPRDALLLVGDEVGAAVDQFTPCTPVSAFDPPFGDVNCDGEVDLDDALAVLAWFADLDYDAEPSCPEIGELLPG